jgi:hypothetical protein
MLMGMDPYGGRESAMRGTSGNSLIHVEFVRNKLKHWLLETNQMCKNSIHDEVN